MKGDRELFKKETFIKPILEFFVPVHPDGHKFIALALFVALLGFFLWEPIGWLSALIGLWVGYFFRDPPRVVPLRKGLVLAPADGRITSIDKVRPSPELQLGDEERLRISIFLSVFDVHINRSPIMGKIKHSKYIKGAFFNAALDKASEENERQILVIETIEGRQIGVVQIAGLIARRIVCFVMEGHTLGVGERIGLIRFGSRVDTYLPPQQSALVAVGQRAIAGETIFADLNLAVSRQEYKEI
ncbi:MAG: phosphatidylserine decarboxylase [Hyphomicrobium sp.]